MSGKVPRRGTTHHARREETGLEYRTTSRGNVNATRRAAPRTGENGPFTLVEEQRTMSAI
jgi:hypothetical protein